MRNRLFVATVALGLLAGALSAGAAERMLINFARPYDAAKIQPQSAKAAQVKNGAEGALRVEGSHAGKWPGVILKAPDEGWDLSPFAQVAVAIRLIGPEPATVCCRVDNRGANGIANCVNGLLEMTPGQIGLLTVDLKRTTSDKLDGKLFGMRGYPVRAGGQGTIDPSRITGMVVFLNHPKADCTFEILRIRAIKDYVAPTAWTRDANPFFPFIDTFGQYKHKDWPGKTHSVEELKANREKEAEALKRETGPSDWDQYGGWAAGPKLKATGFFRTEKLQGKWWLVDPEGRLFFSHGVDCVGEMTGTIIDERQSWFADFPGAQPEFAKFFGSANASKGHFAGRRVRTYTFERANLLRKYGPDWAKLVPQVSQQRLRSWGLNTIANWSDADTCRLRRTPYTDSIGSPGVRRLEGGDGYWVKFPDVFEPNFEPRVRQYIEAKRKTSANDPWCLGYFSDNEMSWGDDVSLAVAALKSPADQPAKQVFVGDLKKQYGEIGKLNQAWGTQYASWEALLQSREAPDRKRAYADLNAFYVKTAERYFQVVRDAVKAVAPNQLYLGCRFAGFNPSAAAAAAKFCDVVSYNVYKKGVDRLVEKSGADKPLLVGEFHFGALDRGMFHTGLVPTDNQAARAQAYSDYVRGALRDPRFVGVAWFKWQDEPNTGRPLDEENYQIGFLDIADTPYPELVAASREVAKNMYSVRMGE